MMDTRPPKVVDERNADAINIERRVFGVGTANHHQAGTKRCTCSAGEVLDHAHRIAKGSGNLLISFTVIVRRVMSGSGLSAITTMSSSADAIGRSHSLMLVRLSGSTRTRC